MKRLLKGWVGDFSSVHDQLVEWVIDSNAAPRKVAGALSLLSGETIDEFHTMLKQDNPNIARSTVMLYRRDGRHLLERIVREHEGDVVKCGLRRLCPEMVRGQGRLGIGDLADLLGVCSETLCNWMKQGLPDGVPMPRRESGRTLKAFRYVWAEEEARAWVQAFLDGQLGCRSRDYDNTEK